MSNHILNVTKIKRDEDGGFVDYEYTIECPTGTCGWIECEEDHPCEDHPDGDPDDDCEVCEPVDGDEHHFHGQCHEYMTCADWTVPYDGCCVDVASDGRIFDLVYDLPSTGRYYIDDDWDDTDCTLSLIGPVEA